MLEQLIDIQRRNSWPDGEVARRLGISRSYWCHLRRGNMQFTPMVAVRAAGAFPELTRALLDIVSVSASTNTASGVR